MFTIIWFYVSFLFCFLAHRADKVVICTGVFSDQIAKIKHQSEVDGSAVFLFIIHLEKNLPRSMRMQTSFKVTEIKF